TRPESPLCAPRPSNPKSSRMATIRIAPTTIAQRSSVVPILSRSRCDFVLSCCYGGARYIVPCLSFPNPSNVPTLLFLPQPSNLYTFNALSNPCYFPHPPFTQTFLDTLYVTALI